MTTEGNNYKVMSLKLMREEAKARGEEMPQEVVIGTVSLGARLVIDAASLKEPIEPIVFTVEKHFGALVALAHAVMRSDRFTVEEAIEQWRGEEELCRADNMPIFAKRLGEVADALKAFLEV